MTPSRDPHLLFIGDSVTDCGRQRPVGTGTRSALGDGYVACVEAMLAKDPGLSSWRITNMGISGNTVRDLAMRWQTDVLDQNPRWLSVLIGINDVWRHFDRVDTTAAVPVGEFEATYRRLLSDARPGLSGLVLLTPFYVQSDRTDPMRRQMDQYGEVVRRLAAEHEALLVDLQGLFDRMERSMPFDAIAPDRVHPSPAGHEAIAGAFLGVLRPALRARP